MKTRQRSFSLFASSLFLFTVGLTAAIPQRGQAQAPAVNSPAQEQPRKGGFGDLVGALKHSPGCIGVKTAQSSSGKLVVFAWFKDKKATQDWYYSQTHQALMGMMGKPSSRKPLENVKDEKMPILVIASITQAAKPDTFTKMPVSQIAIELYAPVTGGFAYNGRFAPSALVVPGMAIAEAQKPKAK